MADIAQLTLRVRMRWWVKPLMAVARGWTESLLAFHQQMCVRHRRHTPTSMT